jgi:hypothetical protein
MIRWVCAELDEMDEADRYASINPDGSIKPVAPEHAEKYRAWREAAGLEKLAARHGYPELLRKHYPDLAEFLYAPKLKRGEKYQNNSIDNIDHAVKDVKRVGQIWQKHYGRKNRRRDNPPSAVEIAAKHNGTTEHAVLKRQKRGKR